MNKIGRQMVALLGIVEHVPSGDVLLMKRSDYDDSHDAEIWEAPGGRKDQFEAPLDALRREIKEEAGLELSKIVQPISTFQYFRGETSAEKEVVGIVYWVQTESKDVTLSEEHTEFKWVSVEEAVETAAHDGIKHDFEAFRAARERHRCTTRL